MTLDELQELAAREPPPPGMRHWLDLARWLKRRFVESADADLLPTVIGKRGGKTQALAVALELDERRALDAAYSMRRGLQSDVIIVICDGYRAFEQQSSNEKELSDAELNARFGSLQERFERADPMVTEALLCLVAHESGRVQNMALPYRREGRKGIKWLPTISCDTDAGDDLKGFMPDHLRSIMRLRPVHETLPELGQAAAAAHLSPGRRDFHLARAMLRVLRERQFYVFDFLEEPES